MSSTIGLRNLIAISLIILHIKQIRAEKTSLFKLTITGYSNPSSKLTDGQCCSSPLVPRSKDYVCPEDSCDLALVVCLKQYQLKFTRDRHCVFADFNLLVGNASNMAGTVKVIDIPFTWPGSFSMAIDVVHHIKNTTIDRTKQRILTSQITRYYNASSGTRNVQGINDFAGLNYTYSVICKPGFYGPRCSGQCTPRDDELGHYDCDENGVSCHPGWHGDFCKDFKCSSECKRGKCVGPNTCRCDEGWTGDLCDTCKGYPGCVHGSCDPQGNSESLTCMCYPGWQGTFCNFDHRTCQHNPCEGNTECVNTPVFDPRRNIIRPGYKCKCLLGYIEQQGECKRKQSCLLPKHACVHGTCTPNDLNEYECECHQGFTGDTCQNKSDAKCYVEPCSNGGVCKRTTHMTTVCECPRGFTGIRCENKIEDACSLQPCSNGATCQSNSRQVFRCHCAPGFTGKYCTIQLPSPTSPASTVKLVDTSHTDSPLSAREVALIAVFGITFPIAMIISAVFLTLYLRRGVCQRNHAPGDAPSPTPATQNHAHKPRDYQYEHENLNNCRKLNNKLDDFRSSVAPSSDSGADVNCNTQSEVKDKVKDCNKQLARERMKYGPTDNPKNTPTNTECSVTTISRLHDVYSPGGDLAPVHSVLATEV